MNAQEREYLTERRELSLGHDPDLIARYLAGEDLTEALRERGSAELPVLNAPRKPTPQAKTPRVDKPGIDTRGPVLTGGNSTQTARQMGRTALPIQNTPGKPASRARSSQVNQPGGDKPGLLRFPQPGAPRRSPKNSPRWSLVAVGIALAVFAISIFIAIR